jgi:AcrR family transcriptional regulator
MTTRLLLEAAAELVRKGQEPSIAELAEVAEVSRATAYRYFPTKELLLAEVTLFAAGGPLEIGEQDGSVPVPDAVAAFVRQVAEWAFANEQPLRTLLRLSLDPATGVRRPGTGGSGFRSCSSPSVTSCRARRTAACRRRSRC